MKSNTIVSFLIVAIVALVIGFLGVQVMTDFSEGYSENRQHFERYCEERFGDEADVWVGGGQGVHSGYHCSTDAGATVHLGAVDGMTWQQYKRGEASAADVTASVEPIGPMGTPMDSLAGLVPPMMVVALAVLVIGVIQRFRNAPKPE